jgi:hypothetical protein
VALATKVSSGRGPVDVRRFIYFSSTGKKRTSVTQTTAAGACIFRPIFFGKAEGKIGQLYLTWSQCSVAVFISALHKTVDLGESADG